jgi:hypothetical protein
MEGKRLQLLVVYLQPDEAAFYRWNETAWRNFVLFDAPRRWVHVPPPNFFPGTVNSAAIASRAPRCGAEAAGR